jgi:uncharacterized protein (TIGR02001 family)
MKKLILATAVVATLASCHALAEDKQSDNATSFNAALASDYRYRGISQTRLQPALQGGYDFSNTPTGLYVGTWLSTITWAKDAGGGGIIEWDIYGGVKGELAKDVSYDDGLLTYVYPSNELAHVAGFVNANTTEVYGQIGYGPAYAKYSQAFTNLFGFVDSKGSGYFDIGANIEAGNGLVVNLHAGRQNVKHNSAAGYTDWKVGVTKDFGVVSASLAVIGTNANESAYTSPANGKFLGKAALVAIVSKTF